MVKSPQSQIYLLVKVNLTFAKFHIILFVCTFLQIITKVYKIIYTIYIKKSCVDGVYSNRSMDDQETQKKPPHDSRGGFFCDGLSRRGLVYYSQNSYVIVSQIFPSRSISHTLNPLSVNSLCDAGP